MIQEVKFDRTTVAIGRNGRMKCIGITMIHTNYPNSSVCMSPLNTKGIGHCDIVIPIEAIPDLIEKLKKF